MKTKSITTFLLIFLANLLVGLVFISILATFFFGGMMGTSITSIFILSVPIVLISLLCYVSLKYFDISRTKLFVNTILISILVSVGSFGFFFFMEWLLGSIVIPIGPGGIEEIESIVNIFRVSSSAPIIFSLIAIFLYNVFPVLELIQGKTQNINRSAEGQITKPL